MRWMKRDRAPSGDGPKVVEHVAVYVCGKRNLSLFLLSVSDLWLREYDTTGRISDKYAVCIKLYV
jgi:hypothetical protein